MLRRSSSLDDRYRLESGTVLLTGIQALVRLPLDQARRDRRAGLATAGFISGYRGSPLGMYDHALWRAKEHLQQHDIAFVPGLNDDLAATAPSAGRFLLLEQPGLWRDRNAVTHSDLDPGLGRTLLARAEESFRAGQRHAERALAFNDDWASIIAGRCLACDARRWSRFLHRAIILLTCLAALTAAAFVFTRAVAADAERLRREQTAPWYAMPQQQLQAGEVTEAVVEAGGLFGAYARELGWKRGRSGGADADPTFRIRAFL